MSRHSLPHISASTIDRLDPQATCGMQRDQKLLSALAHRIDPLCIEVPGLSARSEDIPLMATALLDQRHLNLAGPAQRLGRDAIDRLIVYPWPGNFEELDSAIRQACHDAIR